jgi:hypothetical protein
MPNRWWVKTGHSCHIYREQQNPQGHQSRWPVNTVTPGERDPEKRESWNLHWLTQASSHERFPSHSAMRMESGNSFGVRHLLSGTCTAEIFLRSRITAFSVHLVLGCISGLLIGVIGWIHFRARRTLGPLLPDYRLPLEFLAALVVAFTGHLGGVLSGVNVPS